MANIFMRFPGGKRKAVTLSYDDGVEQDQRLIQTMDRYGIKGTFNLNSGCYAAEDNVYPVGQIHRRMTEKQVTELYTDSGHEVAVHTWSHPFLEKLPTPLVMQELLKDREKLEAQFHTIVRGMAYPYGTYNDEVVDCVKKAGLVYSRTTISSHRFDLPLDWLRLEATCHHNDRELMRLAQKFVEEETAKDPWLFYLWGHSYEFEQNDNWNVIEELCAYMGGREDIWYATNIQIYDYIQAYHSLIFSADGRLVSNPTAVDVSFVVDDREYCVESGCTAELD